MPDIRCSMTAQRCRSRRRSFPIGVSARILDTSEPMLEIACENCHFVPLFGPSGASVRRRSSIGKSLVARQIGAESWGSGAIAIPHGMRPAANCHSDGPRCSLSQPRSLPSQVPHESMIWNHGGRWISLGRTTMMWLSIARDDHERREEETRVARLSTVRVRSGSILRRGIASRQLGRCDRSTSQARR
jgi:hypothetical protein